MDFIPDVEGDDVQAAYARWVASSGHVDAAVGIFEAHPFVKAAQVVTISTPLHNFEIHGFSLNIRSERVMKALGRGRLPRKWGCGLFSFVKLCRNLHPACLAATDCLDSRRAVGTAARFYEVAKDATRLALQVQGGWRQ
jgi:hypothetical protein